MELLLGLQRQSHLSAEEMYDITVDIELEGGTKITGIDPFGKWVQGCAAQWAVRVGTRVRFNIQAFD